MPNQTALVELDDITWDDFPSVRPKQPTVMEIEVTITEDVLLTAPSIEPATPTRRAVRAKRPVWPWVTMMTVAVSVLGVAAFDGRGPAQAAPIPAATVVEDAGAELPISVATRIGRSERSGPILQLNDSSIASGGPNGGSLTNGVRLPMRGIGYYTYDPSTQSGPQAPGRRWGTSTLISQITDLGDWWNRTHPKLTPLGVGDLSLEHGGFFGGPGVGHASHQNGTDFDIRLPRADGVAGPANPGNYDRALTQELVDRLVAQGASLVLIGPSLDLTGPAGVVTRWPNHDDHLHIRFPDPDGSGN